MARLVAAIHLGCSFIALNHTFDHSIYAKSETKRRRIKEKEKTSKRHHQAKVVFIYS